MVDRGSAFTERFPKTVNTPPDPKDPAGSAGAADPPARTLDDLARAGGTDREPVLPQRAGPLLYARGADRASCRVAALVVMPEGEAAPVLRLPDDAAPEPEALAHLFGRTIWRWDFALPARADAAYTVDGRAFKVAADLSGDLRIAFLSCNGQEEGDAERPLDERDVMWQRLAADHARAPCHLLLHGGDQLYADEMVTAHPELTRWQGLAVRDRGTVAFTDEMRTAARRWLFSRYLALVSLPTIAGLMATVPSLMMWDDHDIMDGWGSHPPAILDSPVGRGLFQVAREMFALLQLGARPDMPPSICADPAGGSYTWAAGFPGFTVIAPDLRSERRPQRVMAENGWHRYESLLHAAPASDRRLVISTVPGLGPRLSWLEWVMDIIPRAQKYEDDLRDQWQSRAHRAEWRRFLAGLERDIVARQARVTLLSGEIHLAGRGEMQLGQGRRLHQLISSGIAHPRPPAIYGFVLGLLARLGGEPLPGRRIRMHPLPGRRRTYTGQRNYLTLYRSAGQWSADWELEDSGRTEALEI